MKTFSDANNQMTVNSLRFRKGWFSLGYEHKHNQQNRRSW